MAIKYYCDRCGNECNERFIVEITKGSTEFQYEHLNCKALDCMGVHYLEEEDQ